MKLPALVIAEALSSLGGWHLSADDPAHVYGFPRQFDGHGLPVGHVLLLPPGVSPPNAAAGVLGVCPSPAVELPEGCAVLVPDRAMPQADIERALGALFDRMEFWEEALSECAPDMDGVQKMLDISAKAMQGSLTLIDESYNMPAYAGPQAASYGKLIQGQVRPDDASIADLADDPAITAARSAVGVQLYESISSDARGGRALYRNLFRPGEDHYYNRLLFTRPSDNYTAADRFMLEHLARRIEPITRALPTFSVPVSALTALKQLIASAAQTDFRPGGDMSAALSPLGWRPEDPCRLLVFRSLYARRDAGINDYILRRLERLLPGSCGALDAERVLLVIDAARCPLTFREIRSRLAEFLRENMYKAGISNEAASFDRLRGAYLQALSAMELGSLRDPMFWYYLFEDYLQDYLLRKATEDIPADMLTLPAVETLRRHDAERGTHFVETLRALCEEDFNVSHAARRLYIHRTSFQDRMDRIRALTGLDPEDSEVRFLLQFSFRLLKIHPEG